MKYNVTLSYHGSFTQTIEAESEEKALEAARCFAGAMSDSELNEAIELIEQEHNVETTCDDNEQWKAPRYTRNDILKEAEHHIVSYLKDINDSMELDSAGEDLAWIKNTIMTRSGKKLMIDAALRVQGDVKVIFKGETYRNASKMPKELLECYHNDKDPLTIAPDYYVSMNNWFELFVKITDEKGISYEESYVLDSNDEDDWPAALADTVIDVLNNEQEYLGMFFKKDDTVRWMDPDKSIEDQMSPEDLKEYKQREFKFEKMFDETASLWDGTTSVDVFYSELLLKDEKA